MSAPVLVAPPGRRAEAATLRRFAGREGIETQAAVYVRQRFRPHAHDGYVLGLIERGAHSVWCRGRRHDAVGGTLATFNPGEVHHGGAGDPGGWVQRMVYIGEGALRALVEDAADGGAAGAPGFGEPFRQDPDAARLFAAAHRAIHAPETALARDAALNGLVVRALARSSSGFPPRPRDASPERLRRMRDYLHAHAEDDVTLARLAAVGGLRERHTIALFRRHLGLPPHGYHLQLKVAAVRRMLRAGRGRRHGGLRRPEPHGAPLPRRRGPHARPLRRGGRPATRFRSIALRPASVEPSSTGARPAEGREMKSVAGRRGTWVADAALLGVAVAWGASYPVAKGALLVAPVLVLLLLRFALSAVVLAGPARRDLAAAAPDDLRRGTALGGLLFVIFMAETGGVALTTATNAAFIISLCTVLTPCLDFALSGRLSPAGVLGGAALCCLGAAVLGGGLSGLNGGDALMLGAAVLRAALVIATKRVMAGRSLSASALTAVQSAVVALLAGLTLLVVPGAASFHAAPDLAFWAAVLVLALIGTGATFALNAALRRASPSRVSFLLGTEPVFGFAFAHLLLAEPVTPAALLGGGLILCGTLVGLGALR